MDELWNFIDVDWVRFFFNKLVLLLFIMFFNLIRLLFEWLYYKNVNFLLKN